jgi:ABC-type nitrate/sulfonate/bicarbonate transport system ATPase subunit
MSASAKADDIASGMAGDMADKATEAAPAGGGNIYECDAVSLELFPRGQRRLIIDQLSLDVRAGEFLTIVGSSGTGKSTLLRLLGGLMPASSGAIRFRGAAVTSAPSGVVVVFQDYSNALLQWRSVARNVALGIEGKLDQAEIDRRVRQSLQMVGLEKNAKDHPWQLSGGMQQRVQIARALALNPDVMLMDEPFGALDAMTKASLQDEVLQVHARTGTSFVFITHDIEEAVYLGDRVVVLAGPPGQIHKIVEITLPRPRDQIRTRQSAEFLNYRAELHAAVLSAGGH